MNWPLFLIVGGLVLDALAFLILANDVVDLTRKLPGWDFADRSFMRWYEQANAEFERDKEAIEEIKRQREELTKSMAESGGDTDLLKLEDRVDAAIRTLALTSKNNSSFLLAMTRLFDGREDAVKNRQTLTLWRAYLAVTLFVIGAAMQIMGLILPG